MADKVVKGSCMCGGMTFSLDAAPDGIADCYCSDCQKNAGGPFQTMAQMKTANVVVDNGGDGGSYRPNDDKARFAPNHKVHTILKTGSGKPKEKHFCGACGCTLWTLPLVYEGDVTFVRTTMVEDGLSRWKSTLELFKPAASA